MEFPNWGIPNHCHGIMSLVNESPIQDMKIPFCDRGFPIYHQISMHIINIRCDNQYVTMPGGKRKLEQEGRVFNDDWKLRYFVKLHANNQAICVICNTTIAALKEYNVRRHYSTRHADSYDKYTEKEREEKYATLSTKLANQQQHFRRYTELSEKATKCSLVISQRIGERQLPFSHGEFAKEVIYTLSVNRD